MGFRTGDNAIKYVAIAVVAVSGLVSFVAGMSATGPPAGFNLTWRDLAIVLPSTIVGVAFCLGFAYPLNAASAGTVLELWKVGRRWRIVYWIAVCSGAIAGADAVGLALGNALGSKADLGIYIGFYATISAGIMGGCGVTYGLAKLLGWPIQPTAEPDPLTGATPLKDSRWKRFLGRPAGTRVAILLVAVAIVLVLLFGFILWESSGWPSVRSCA